jgi:hypothetical protein
MVAFDFLESFLSIYSFYSTFSSVFIEAKSCSSKAASVLIYSSSFVARTDEIV